ncbi:Hypothetical_protein [Hexamita inflata]|uniref:Hypothetical_protein n=1 Tax=Hexamita inflata TaxID=28002 RepID=A0AA86PGQ7_9EUKA|nr:Hypothetical protein HINF_LOCUS25647 [Hexamita inflata]
MRIIFDKSRCKRKTKDAIFITCIILLSPIILAGIVLLLLFLAIVLPMQSIQNKKLLKKFDNDRRRKFLSKQNQQQLTEQNQQEDDNKQQIQKQMFIFKPINQLDLYFCINNGNIEILSKDLCCLYKQSIKYNFQPLQEESYAYNTYQKSLCRGSISEMPHQIPPAHLTDVQYFGNKIYFSVLDYIFIINEDLSVDFVQHINEFGRYFRRSINSYFNGGQMFTMNNKLYVHNQSQKLFELKQNNKLKCISKKHHSIFYCQFCDKVYAVNNSDIYIVNQQLQLVNIKQLYDIKILFASGGTLVISSDAQYLYVLNMLDTKLVSVKQEEINLSQIMIPYQLELGPTGLQLKDEILVKLFGIDFPYRLVTHYNNYHNNQFIKCQNNFLKSFFNSKIDLVTKNQWSKANQQFSNVQSKILDQQTQISQAISNLVVSCNLMSSKFTISFDESQYQ